MDEIVLRFGCPKFLISDRGSSWLNQFFQAFLQMPQMAIFHIRTSAYHPESNGLCEKNNQHIIRHLRAFCTDKKRFHEFLPAIAAGINGTVNSALGTSPFFVLFGQNYCSPVDTIMSEREQSFRDGSHPDGLKSLADRMAILRDIIHENIKDARANTERVKNANARPHNFEIGQRVFVSQELESSKIHNRKHSPLYVGPYVIVDLNNSLVRLQHFYSGKLLKNWINVCKLKRLRDESRDRLYNKINQALPQTSAQGAPDQPTVQTAIQGLADFQQSQTPSARSPEMLQNIFHEKNIQLGKTARTVGQRRGDAVTSGYTGPLHSKSNVPGILSSGQSTVGMQSETSNVQASSEWASLWQSRWNARSTALQQIPAWHACRMPQGDNNRYASSYPTRQSNLPCNSEANGSRSTEDRRLAQSHTKANVISRQAENMPRSSHRAGDIPHGLSTCESQSAMYAEQSQKAGARNTGAQRLQSTQQASHGIPELKAATQPAAYSGLALTTESVGPQQTAYYAASKQLTQVGFDSHIVRISACKRRKPQPLYKAHFNNGEKPRWVEVTQVPPRILAAFHVSQFQRRRKRAHKIK